MIQLCLREKITDCSLKLALALAKSFMPNQAAKVAKIMNGTHTKPAFCSQICTVSLFFIMVCGSPPNAPNRLAVMANGTTNCTADTPRLPKPAFKPSALPFSALGKKKLMLAMLEEKLPPPKPHNRARITMVL